jgi:DNA-binding NarL/FixJ family response regulator
MNSKFTSQFSPAEQGVIISHNCLTPTEIEVLQKVADKGSVRRAAQAICRSETTLKRELAAIRAKLGGAHHAAGGGVGAAAGYRSVSAGGTL